MGGLGSFLVALAGPVAKRVLSALGIGLVSYAAISTALGQVLANAKTAWAGIGGDALGLIQLAGLGQALSIVAGALVARVSIIALRKFQVLA